MKYSDRPWWDLFLSPKQWGENRSEELENCLSNTHNSINKHRYQLQREFGIYFNAQLDRYIKIESKSN